MVVKIDTYWRNWPVDPACGGGVRSSHWGFCPGSVGCFAKPSTLHLFAIDRSLWRRRRVSGTRLTVCGPLVLLFILVPVTEIYLIIKVGGILGALPTVAIVVATAFIGASLVQSQGTVVFRRLQAAMARGEGAQAAIVIAESVLILVAGVTLLAPGFLTDAVGIALLLPPIRKVLARLMVKKMKAKVVTVRQNYPKSHVYPPPSQPGRDDDLPPPGVIDV